MYKSLRNTIVQTVVESKSSKVLELATALYNQHKKANSPLAEFYKQKMINLQAKHSIKEEADYDEEDIIEDESEFLEQLDESRGGPDDPRKQKKYDRQGDNHPVFRAGEQGMYDRDIRSQRKNPYPKGLRHDEYERGRGKRNTRKAGKYMIEDEDLDEASPAQMRSNSQSFRYSQTINRVPNSFRSQLAARNAKTRRTRRISGTVTGRGNFYASGSNPSRGKIIRARKKNFGAPPPKARHYKARGDRVHIREDWDIEEYWVNDFLLEELKKMVEKDKDDKPKFGDKDKDNKGKDSKFDKGDNDDKGDKSDPKFGKDKDDKDKSDEKKKSGEAARKEEKQKLDKSVEVHIPAQLQEMQAVGTARRDHEKLNFRTPNSNTKYYDGGKTVSAKFGMKVGTHVHKGVLNALHTLARTHKLQFHAQELPKTILGKRHYQYTLHGPTDNVLNFHEHLRSYYNK